MTTRTLLSPFTPLHRERGCVRIPRYCVLVCSLSACQARVVEVPCNASSATQGKSFEDAQGHEVRLDATAFADVVVSYTPGRESNLSRNSEAAVGAPDRELLSLGCDGVLTLEFMDNRLIDVPGPDLHIFEGGTAVESTLVEVSADGVSWKTGGEVRGQPAALDLQAVLGPGESMRFVRLTNRSTLCGTHYAGADIDAVGAIGSQPVVQAGAAR